MYGRGLNSIPWRFATASAVLTVVGILVRDFEHDRSWVMSPADLLSLAVLAGTISAITFFMARKLTGTILSLRRSTDAIAAGDLDNPVDVNCACEVGGLADSFRKMANHLNANILRMKALAYIDPITALPNRSVIDHLLAHALAPERSEQFHAAIIFIGLDGFKRINDTLGRDGGDELLQLASRRILEQGLNRTVETLDNCSDGFGNPCNRLPIDIVFARYAGDEFVAILPGTMGHDALRQTGLRIVSAMRAPFRIKNQDVTIGASVGIAIAPDDTISAEDAIVFSDVAMHSAKRAGGARVVFFDKSLRDTIVERAQLETDLRAGLARGELVLDFQPKVETRTLALCGVEALVRWRHPTRGLLAPGVFIDIAEQAGLMPQLGRQVLALAVRQCRLWLDAGIERPIAVNVSPSQFADEGFVQSVLAQLRNAGVPPFLISVEITESIAMADAESTAKRLAVLRGAGVRVAIDDFGVGFSNLSQLSCLPVDDLKIDRSLVVGIGANGKSEAIIRAILGMARALGFRVIAEGIETPTQMRFLTELGCHVAQGFYIGRPMAVQQLEHWCTTQAGRTMVQVVPASTVTKVESCAV